jgi:NaMN:DMB phosphoribosyltransferase
VTEQPASSQPPPAAPTEPAREPAVGEAQTRREQVSAYTQGSVANMLRSLLVIGAIMAVLALMFPRVQPEVPDIDVTETAQQVEQSTGWPISAPRDLPEG